MNNKSRMYILFHVLIISLLLFFFLGSLLYLLINLIPITYLVMGLLKVGEKNA